MQNTVPEATKKIVDHHVTGQNLQSTALSSLGEGCAVRGAHHSVMYMIQSQLKGLIQYLTNHHHQSQNCLSTQFKLIMIQQ